MSQAVKAGSTVDVRRLRTLWHETSSAARKCIHTLDDPPEAFLVIRAAVERLNFQPRVITKGAPCIASRIGLTLTIGFDVIGPIDSPHVFGDKDQRVVNRWDYQLLAIDDSTELLVAIRESRDEQ